MRSTVCGLRYKENRKPYTLVAMAGLVKNHDHLDRPLVHTFKRREILPLEAKPALADSIWGGAPTHPLGRGHPHYAGLLGKWRFDRPAVNLHGSSGIPVVPPRCSGGYVKPNFSYPSRSRVSRWNIISTFKMP
jgi:hypothetical protein